MTGPQDPAAAGRGRLRAGHADREQAIDTLKTAFVHGQLTKDEFDARAGQALAARTYADLAALTADIPPRSPAARPARPPAPVRRRPLARAAAKSGVCLIIAAAATWVLALLVSADGHYHGIPGANPSYESWAPLPLLLALTAVCTAISILGSAVVTSLEQRRSRRQLPPGPGGHALEAERRGGTGHGPVPPGPRAEKPGRPAGSQVTAAPTAYSHPGGPGIPWREAGARHGLTRQASAGTGCLPGRPSRGGPRGIRGSSTPRPGAHRCCLRWRSYARHRWPSRSPSSRRPARTAWRPLGSSRTCGPRYGR